VVFCCGRIPSTQSAHLVWFCRIVGVVSKNRPSVTIIRLRQIDEQNDLSGKEYAIYDERRKRPIDVTRSASQKLSTYQDMRDEMLDEDIPYNRIVTNDRLDSIRQIHNVLH